MKPRIAWLILLSLPLRHLSVTSPYGYRIHPVTGRYCFHAGVDLRACHDTVYAVINGRITTGCHATPGRFVQLTNGRFDATYAHLSQIFVQTGDSVAAATPLGITGATGRVTGEHLHFAIQFNHHYIDPLAFLAAAITQFNQ